MTPGADAGAAHVEIALVDHRSVETVPADRPDGIAPGLDRDGHPGGVGMPGATRLPSADIPVRAGRP